MFLYVLVEDIKNNLRLFNIRFKNVSVLNSFKLFLMKYFDCFDP